MRAGLMVLAASTAFTLGSAPAAMCLDRKDTTVNEERLITFDSPDSSDKWMIVNDGVMGGLSTSSFEVTDSGTGVFSGTVSLDNNGGFASTRTIAAGLDSEAADGIVLRVKGDGKSYRFRIRTEQQSDGVAYQHSFDTRSGEWMEVRLPFRDFVASFRGRILPDVPPLDPSLIAQMGFLIADKQAGTFRLEIDWIDRYAE